jgi:small subunit ribosomal protein S11
MGKKKIQKQSETEVLKETEAQESAQKKAGSQQSSKNKRVERGKVFIQSTYNNTLITICDSKGDTLAWASAGALGFKGPKKATPYAASKTVEALMEKVRKVGLKEIDVFVKGIGSGREAAVRAFATQGLNIFSIKDVTPVPHNGCRPPKVRRV